MAGDVFDTVRSMREQWEGDVGDFIIYDGRGEKVGNAKFALTEEYCVVASSTWGTIEVRSFIKESKQAVSVKGALLATVFVRGLASKVELKMASGQDILLKHALLSDALRYKGESGEIDFRFKKVVEKNKPGECSISISGSCGARPEDIALALMSWYGFLRVSGVDSWNKSDMDTWMRV